MDNYRHVKQLPGSSLIKTRYTDHKQKIDEVEERKQNIVETKM